MVRSVFKILLAAILLLVVVVLVNTFRKTSVQVGYEVSPAPPLTDSALAHFAQAISYRTISYGDPSLFDPSQFIGFHDLLKRTYPMMHEHLQLETFEGYSLLYTWRGTDSSLKPIILMAHQDVVPIEETTRDQWTVDPFAGTIKDNFIWGRGTTDDKINLISICEAVEKLLAEGFRPARTVHLAFGHDEEIGGKGAKAIAAKMESMGILAEMVLDEGGIITKEKMPGLEDRPVALLGTAEKGYLSLDLTVKATGGHSSMPERETAVDILSKALVNLRAKPFPARFSEPVLGQMEALGPEMPFLQRMAFANPWLFKPLIASTFSKSGPGNAMIRTTLVPTIIEAGIKDNVVPSQAVATVNMRLLPGDSIPDVVKKVNDIIGDKRVVVEPRWNIVAEPSGVSSAKGFGYQKIDKIMKRSYAGTITAPFLMIGASDSRHFNKVSSNIIKFSPMIDPIGFHGIDERVSLESFQTALWFYEQLLRDQD
ncbi:MAG TPA: M20 family peptidase [Phnomibacter sp.]|nr:M20 family peptidase [Phnomibacter sp.]